MTVAIALPTLSATDDETRLVRYHLERLASFEPRNRRAEAYYEGRKRVDHIGVSIPPGFEAVRSIVGWGGQIVDVLEERLDFQGWTDASGADPYGLQDVYNENGLDVDGGLGHLDALIYGTAFVAAGSPYADESTPILTVESPRHATGEWDGRARRLSSGITIDKLDDTDGQPEEVTLYLPNGNVTLTRYRGAWRIIDTADRPGRDNHNLGRVLLARLVNRPRASRVEGRSEISRAIRSYTDTGVRTLLGMEVHREFYQAPQRYALNVDEGAFVGADGKQATGWEAIMGRVWAIPANEESDVPIEVGQFTPASPAPYLEQVRGLSLLVAAEAGLPAFYLGFVTDNPTSADAIRQAEARLVKRAERRQATFGRAWREVAALALLSRDGRLPDDFGQLGVKWRDAATPTRSAATDEAVKLIGSGVLQPDSPVTWDRLGFSPLEKRTLEADHRRARAARTLAALASPTSPIAAVTEAASAEPEAA